MSTELLLLAAGAIAAAPLAIAVLIRLSLMEVLALVVAARTMSDIGAGGSSGSLLPSSILAIAISGLALALTLLAKGTEHGRISSTLIPAAFVIVLFTLPGLAEYGVDTGMLSEVIRLLPIVTLFAVAAITPITIDQVQRLFLICCLPPVVIGLAGSLAQTSWAVSGGGRAVGTFSHANTGGAFFAVTVIIGVVLWTYHRWTSVAVTTVLALLAVLSTQSLGALIGLAFGLGVFALYHRRVSLTTRIIGLAGMTGLGILALSRTSAFGRLSEFRDFSLDEAAVSTTSSDSLSWRIINWRELLGHWTESPIWGHGLGSTVNIRPLGAPPHSLPVQVLVETGVIGFAILIVLIVRAISLGHRLTRMGSLFGPLTLALLGFIVANGSESNLLGYAATDFLLALFLGIASNQARVRVRDSPSTVEPARA